MYRIPPMMSANDEPSEDSNLDIPSYININFIEKALRNKYHSVKVTHLSPLESVSQQGHICNVFRTQVTLDNGTSLALIIKCLNECQVKSKFASDNELTVREMNLYNIMLPSLLQQSQAIKPNIPQCYFTQKKGTVDVLVLEDMKSHGYKEINRKCTLSKEHCEIGLKELAKFHALSLKLKIENPERFRNEIIEKYTENIYNERNREGIRQFLKKTFRNLSKYIVEKHPVRYKTIAELLEKFSNYVGDEMYAMLKKDEDFERILVLCHADLWCNNLLFQYESEKPIQCCIIDFQLAKCSTPTFDLMLLFFTSTCKSMRDQNMDQLLQLYLDEVHQAVPQCPSSVFYQSLEELKQDMRRNPLVPFVKTSVMLPLLVACYDENVFKPSTTDDSSFVKMYQNPEFETRFRGILDDFEHIGLFEDMQKILGKFE
ncbi:hypothetical protein B566_EDAN010244 [Ephemera danica]|nr:hypothetical protein B566_EDAN010244 [Ephemera danica]